MVLFSLFTELEDGQLLNFMPSTWTFKRLFYVSYVVHAVEPAHDRPVLYLMPNPSYLFSSKSLYSVCILLA